MALDEMKIDKLSLDISVKVNRSISNVAKLDKQIQHLQSTIDKLNIDKLNFNVSGGTGRGGGGSSTSAKTKGSIFDVGNLYHIVRLVQFVGRGLQKVGGFMKDIVQSGIDYTETLNLWQVAMGKNADQAEEFINRMAKAYGYATTTLMQYQATFRNMLSNLGGVDSNVSYKLSEYLMQMAGDYASLYNVTIEKAMQSFQSVLAGQVRPIRSVSGYDITENTIFELYQSLGGEKTMRQLSQTEKRLLRIYAIFQQMERSGAVGDLSKTLGNSANQLRIINEQVTELKTWLGNILEMYLRPALPIVQAFLIVATEVAKVIAKNLGYEAFDGTIAGFEEATEKADELAGKLLSFDKFEALNSSSGDNALGIDSKLLEGMAKYESLLDHNNTLAQEMVKDILPRFIDENGELTEGAQKIQDAIEKIFGVTKNLYELNEEGGFKAWGDETDNLNAKLKSTAFLLGSIATLLAGKKLLDGFQTLNSKFPLTKLNLIPTKDIEEKAMGAALNVGGQLKFKEVLALGGKLAIITAIVAALVHLYNTNEDVRQSIDDLFETLKPIGTLVINLVKEILPVVGDLLQALAPIIKVIIDLVKELAVVVEAVLLLLTPVIELVIKLVHTVVKLLDFNNWNTLGGNLKDIWSKSNWNLTSGIYNDTGVSQVASYNFGDYSSTPNGITSPSTAITQSTYNATMASTNSASTVVHGDVYIDGKKAGQILAPHTYNENVRVGNIQPKK